MAGTITKCQEVSANRRCLLAEVRLYIDPAVVHQIWVHKNFGEMYLGNKEEILYHSLFGVCFVSF